MPCEGKSTGLLQIWKNVRTKLEPAAMNENQDVIKQFIFLLQGCAYMGQNLYLLPH